MVKRALLIGCNYPGTNNALKGCVNDVKAIHAMLLDHFGFEEENIKILTDTDEGHDSPTGKTIKTCLNEIVNQCESGDVLVVHFSGHGVQVPAKGTDEEADNKDEAIVPTDLNLITDDDLHAIFDKLPPKVKLTMICDCCHSGSMLDHPEQQISGNKAEDADDDIVAASFGEEGGEGASNRALKTSDLMGLISSKFGVNASEEGGIHGALFKMFGSDSSAKTLCNLGQFQQLAEQLQGQGGSLGQIGGMLAGLTASGGGGGGGGGGALGGLGGLGGGALGGLLSGGGGKDPEPEAPPPEQPAGLPPHKKPVAGEGGEGDGALITGCQASETSADACPGGDPSRAYGAMTNALTTTVRQFKEANPDSAISYKELVLKIRGMLGKAKFAQNPCLECADETIDSAFVCEA